MKSKYSRNRGFTMLELLVALAIMAGAMAVIMLTFTTTVRGWRRGSEMLEELHHGDFVMEQLVSALRSTAFFYNDPSRFGLWMEDLEGQEYPADKISFVTAGTAFMPPNSPLANGLHRIEITIEENEDDETAVAIRAYPHLTQEEDWESEPWYVSTVVKGLNIRTYDVEDEEWEDEWEDTNAVPSLVEITLFMDPLEDFGDPVILSRLVEIPIAPAVANAVDFRQADEDAATDSEATAESAAGQAAGTQQVPAGSTGGGAPPGAGPGSLSPGGSGPPSAGPPGARR